MRDNVCCSTILNYIVADLVRCNLIIGRRHSGLMVWQVGGGGGGGTPLYGLYTFNSGMCSPKGYSFSAILVVNRVWF